MKLIIGLGNPGDKYQKTRHNLGFMVVEKFLKDFEPVRDTFWENQTKLKSDIAEIIWQPRYRQEEKVILAKPKTYMNNSGLAVSLISEWFSIPISDIWIIHDDIDLPFSSMKIRFGGASAGHHGLESIMANLGTDKFWRFRLGIGYTSSKFKMQSSKLRDMDDYVLGKFTGAEKGKVRELIKRGVRAIETGLEEGLDVAMNRFNTK